MENDFLSLRLIVAFSIYDFFLSPVNLNGLLYSDALFLLINAVLAFNLEFLLLAVWLFGSPAIIWLFVFNNN